MLCVPLLKLLLCAVPLQGCLVEVARDELLDVAVAFAVGEGKGQQKAVDLRGFVQVSRVVRTHLLKHCEAPVGFLGVGRHVFVLVHGQGPDVMKHDEQQCI